jgi:carboxypeptidase D
MEVGPWKVDGEGGLTTVEGGWEEYTTMVYGESIKYRASTACTGTEIHSSSSVDQPAGTGLSYTSTNHYVHSLQEVRVETYGLAAS